MSPRHDDGRGSGYRGGMAHPPGRARPHALAGDTIAAIVLLLVGLGILAVDLTG